MRRSQMTSAEREWRARLAKVVHRREYLRGTLCVREGTCGKAGCKCTRGEKHVQLVLERSDNGKRRQVYVPKAWEKRVRMWIKEYREATDLLEKISRVQWWKLREREG